MDKNQQQHLFKFAVAKILNRTMGSFFFFSWARVNATRVHIASTRSLLQVALGQQALSRVGQGWSRWDMCARAEKMSGVRMATTSVID